MSQSPCRGDIWTTDTGTRVLVISSTVYNEIPSEPTVIVVPVFDTKPDNGFGVDLAEHAWAATGLIGGVGHAAQYFMDNSIIIHEPECGTAQFG